MKLKSQAICFRQVQNNCAVYEAASYTRNQGAEMMRVRFEELADDIYDHYIVEFSRDNGQTWGHPQNWSAGQKLAAGTLRRMWFTGFASAGRLLVLGLEGVLRRDHALDGATQYFPVCKISLDGGATWATDERIIQKGREYSPEHPFRGIWVGRNSANLANAPIETSAGRILVPCNVFTLGPDGVYFCPPNAGTFTAGGVAIGTWRKDNRLDWDFGELVRLPPEMSLRGAIEPTLAEMPNGRLLMVLRADAGTDPHYAEGHKWYTVSRDGGHTWETPRYWTYADGQPFYSPSSISLLRRHSNGAQYWIGNICAEKPDGNAPRYPLVIGRVDPATLLLERESLFTIDTRQPGDPASLQLSNFSVSEDRLSGDILLRMTRWDGQTSGGSAPISAHVHLYRIEV